MSDGPIQFLQKDRLLSFEQIQTFVAVVAPLGLNRVRLTGGEPLVRAELHKLVAKLNQISGVDQLALTTNGTLLPQQIKGLVDAGLKRVNISLDTLNEETFKNLSRREGLHLVLAGIDAAIEHGLHVRLNALVMRDINLDEVGELVQFALDRNLTLRFIEFMPLDADRSWSAGRVVTGAQLRKILEPRFGPLHAIEPERVAQPATDYRFVNRPGTVGFIDPVSQPFCAACDRVRLTADGKIRNCLFGQQEWDVKKLLGSDADEATIRRTVTARLQTALDAKFAAHGIADADFVQPRRAMYQIGG